MRYRSMLVILASTAAAMSATSSLAVSDSLLMGDGQLAVVNATSGRADLANITTAVYEDGTLYFDHHIRKAELAGDPPKRELVARAHVDCRGWVSGYTSWQSVNYHTGSQGEPLPMSPDTAMTPINRDFFQADLCRRLVAGTPVREAITHDHMDNLAKFPLFALSVPDGLRPAKIESGEIVEMEETELLQHLRRVNPEF